MSTEGKKVCLSSILFCNDTVYTLAFPTTQGNHTLYYASFFLAGFSTESYL